MDHVDRHLLLRKLRDLVLERLERPRDVGLEHDVELVELTGAGPLEDLLEGDLASLATGQLLGLEPGLALLRELTGLALVVHHLDVLARLGHAVEAEDLDGCPRSGLVHALALVVEHRPDLAPDGAGNDRIPHMEGAALYQHAGDRTAARVELGLHDGPGGGGVGIGAELFEIGDQQDHLEQVVDPVLGLRGDVGVDRVPSPLLGIEVLLCKFGSDAIWVGALLVDLVDRDQDRHVGRAGVVDRLDGLRHDAVVRGDDDHRDVGHAGAAGAHRGERLMARCVEEGELLAVVLHLIRADVLGDPTRLAGRDLRLANGIEQ